MQRVTSKTAVSRYAQFSETLSGITTIRAFGETARFVEQSNAALDSNVKATYLQNCGINRFGPETCFDSTCFELALPQLLSQFAMQMAHVLHKRRRWNWVDRSRCFLSSGNWSGKPRSGCDGHKIFDAGLCGYSHNFACSGSVHGWLHLQVSWALIWLVRSFTDTETMAVSVERVREYATLEPEERQPNPRLVSAKDKLEGWPASGKVEWQGVSLRYRHDLDPALCDMNVTIEAGEHVGVCGRTGAGKSSFTVAMLRLADRIDGVIKIDGVDTSTIGLQTLRRGIALIPQDATMFQGSVRVNLDPLHAHTDDELWRALRSVELVNVVVNAGGLYGNVVSEEGGNWSQGQRQLLCIARALLRRANIVMMDEATASCDLSTDAMVQRCPAFTSHSALLLDPVVVDGQNIFLKLSGFAQIGALSVCGMYSYHHRTPNIDHRRQVRRITKFPSQSDNCSSVCLAATRSWCSIKADWWNLTRQPRLKRIRILYIFHY
eukprot:SAG31_NODE_1766_length_7315_cov_2.439302_6_plen_492_part_00